MRLREETKAEINRITPELKDYKSAQLKELKCRVETFVFASPKGALGYRLDVRDQWVDVCEAAGLMALREPTEPVAEPAAATPTKPKKAAAPKAKTAKGVNSSAETIGTIRSDFIRAVNFLDEQGLLKSPFKH